MRFSTQEYWNGLPFPSPRDLLDPGIKPASPYILCISRWVAQKLKHLPAMQETWVRSLGQGDLLEKEMATRSSILAWIIPWKEEPGGLQSMGLQSRTRLSDFAFTFFTTGAIWKIKEDSTLCI